jgi:hypothetical protein
VSLQASLYRGPQQAAAAEAGPEQNSTVEVLAVAAVAAADEPHAAQDTKQVRP